MESKLFSAVRNIYSAFICRIVGLILPFILRAVMIYTIGAEYLGLTGLYQSIFAFLNIADLGLGSAIVYMMYKPMAEGDTDTICALLRVYRNIYRLIGGIVFISGLAIIPFLPHLIHGEMPQDIQPVVVYLILLLDSCLGYFFFSYRESLFNASQRVDILNYIELWVKVLTSAVQIYLLLRYQNFYLYCIVIPVITLFRNFAVAYISHKKYPQYVCKGTITSEQKQQLRKQVSGLLIGKISGNLGYNLDTIIISAFFGLAVLVKYQNYAMISLQLSTLVGLMQMSVIPGLGNSLVTETKEKNYENLFTYQFMFMWLNGWIAACLVCLYQPFMRFWMGEEMLLADAVIPVFGFYYITDKLNNVCWQFRIASGLWWEERYRAIFSGIFNLVMDLILIHIWGAAGVMIATILYQLFFDSIWGTRILFSNRFSGKNKWEYLKVSYFYMMVIIICCVICYFVCSYLPMVQGRNMQALGIMFLKVMICTVLSNGLMWLIYRRTKEYRNSESIFKRIIHWK